MTPIPILIKLACTGALAIIMLFFAPRVVPIWIHPTTQTTIPERVASSEVKLADIERRLDAMDAARISDRLANIEARQGIVLMMFAPMAMFMFAHSWEVIQRIRSKNLTRHSDRK